jgi:hypothetical protein
MFSMHFDSEGKGLVRLADWNGIQKRKVLATDRQTVVVSCTLVTSAPSNEFQTYGVPLEKSALPMSSGYVLSWCYKYLT